MRRRPALSLTLCLVLALLGQSAARAADTVPATPAPGPVASVPMLGGNPARTGEQPGPGPTGAPAARWAFATGAELVPAVALVGGVAYVSGDDGVLYAVDAATGRERWRAQIGGYEGSTAAVVAGTVYVGGDALYAFDAATGQQRWRARIPGRAATAPAVIDEMVYTTGPEGTVLAVDAATGERSWRVEIGGELLSAAAVADGAVYVAQFDGAVVALDAVSGAERWRVQTGDTIDADPAVADGIVYVHGYGVNREANLAGSARTTLRALDAATGAERWRFDAAGSSGTASSPAVAGGAVYVGIDRYLFAIDGVTGQARWSLATQESLNEPPAVAEGTVYVGSDALYAVDAVTGQERWRAAPAMTPAGAGSDVQVSYRYGTPTVVAGVAYVASSLSAATFSGPDPTIPAVLHAIAGSAAPAVAGPLHFSPCGPPQVLNAEEMSAPVALPAASPTALPATSASMLGGNPARTGEQTGPGPRSTPVPVWRTEVSDLTFVPPAVADDQLFVVTMDGVLVALDTVGGNEGWRADFDVAAHSAPAAMNGIVYVGGADESLLAVDAASGELRWAFPTVGNVATAPAVAGETVFFGTARGSPFTGMGTGVLYAIDAASGAERWSVAVPGPIVAPLAVADGLAIARIGSGCGGPGILVAVDATTGRPRWRTSFLGGSSDLVNPVVANGTVFVSNVFALLALDATSGQERWRQPAEIVSDETQLMAVGAPAVTGGSLYVVDQATSALVSLDAATGQERWRVEIPNLGADQFTNSPAVAGGEIYVNSLDGLLIALSAATGEELWRIDLEGMGTTSPVVAGGIVYVGGTDSAGEIPFLAAVGTPAEVGAPTP